MCTLWVIDSRMFGGTMVSDFIVFADVSEVDFTRTVSSPLMYGASQYYFDTPTDQSLTGVPDKI